MELIPWVELHKTHGLEFGSDTQLRFAEQSTVILNSHRTEVGSNFPDMLGLSLTSHDARFVPGEHRSFYRIVLEYFTLLNREWNQCKNSGFKRRDVTHSPSTLTGYPVYINLS
jgi:hypothetical protein